ncbi:hypothetical protein AGOR_G00246630 [Albula goreensis]|uniref:Peptidase M14 domain-containing protein n=1 Tax=Albula goreensis TaxID=1534307 RepID=A0A8T3CAT6_9TELE|nr:hypothetical protein AGOR_G00246630 [Albula goreensis]
MMVLFTPCLCLWLGAWVSTTSGLDFRYHNTVEIEQYLKAVNRNYSSFTHLHSIGKSVEGRDLWVLVLGKYPNEHKIGIPEFKYVGNMHGNEVVGRVLLLHLIEHLTQGYLSDPEVTRILNSTRVHILPSMNPDGFEASDRDCMFSEGRFNKHGVDLNRNFPDAFERDEEEPREAEVRAIMDWLSSESFVLSANLHGGAVVASYPYDNSNGGAELQRGSSVSPDNDVFVHLAKTYSFSHTHMHKENNCYESKDFKNGITNGYYWYPLSGGMQDYNYVWSQCLEITLELSCCKYPPESDLPGLWRANKPALLAYMQQVHLGVKGQVLDSTGVPVQNALVEVEGRRNLCPFRTDKNGEYYRLLLPGNYTFKVTALGQESITETLSIPHGPDVYSAMTHNFVLQRSSSSVPDVTQPTESCTSKVRNPAGSHSVALLASWFVPLLSMTLRSLLV